MYEPIKASNAIYSQRNIKKVHIPTGYTPSKPGRTHAANEVTIKNALPVARDGNELNKWVKESEKRAMSDEKNPF